jgi:hypothetical protein
MSWLLRDRTATFPSKHARVEVGLQEGGPKLSIHAKDATNDRPLMRVHVAPPELSQSASWNIGDAYVRQNDLVLAYPEQAPWLFSFQVDARLIEPTNRDLLCVELWMSVQTSHLDSHPQLEFRMECDPLESLTPEIWVGRCGTICFAIHPMDRADCVIDRSRQGLHGKLFGRFMEKGVIRRMRIRLMVASVSQKSDFWKERMQEFSGSPLPLTT